MLRVTRGVYFARTVPNQVATDALATWAGPPKTTQPLPGVQMATACPTRGTPSASVATCGGVESPDVHKCNRGSSPLPAFVEDLSLRRPRLGLVAMQLRGHGERTEPRPTPGRGRHTDGPGSHAAGGPTPWCASIAARGQLSGSAGSWPSALPALAISALGSIPALFQAASRWLSAGAAGGTVVSWRLQLTRPWANLLARTHMLLRYVSAPLWGCQALLSPDCLNSLALNRRSRRSWW